MGEYVRRVKTRSGATAVQIASKTRGVRTIIEHIGSAHTDLELELMVQTAKTRVRERAQAAGETELQIDTPTDPVVPRITMQHSYSRLLYDTLVGLYDRLGFTDAVTDRVFRDLVVARLIEPASKLDTIRILENLGLKAPRIVAFTGH
ncbi:hypothetical protein G7067_06820 [Leucobacter insecticola]|uniref:Uncharacterized protein n=1 Tax=Leucobacter insecticola TaxID=2714934 RepID=A0A6G8FIN9_9MICO|nr:hypothetical protein [Leucobacter insecticola]QIM16198.1 hypothetical protein G7067_06820 [Leucobacter insecticola]